jgi:hypothetical protein
MRSGQTKAVPMPLSHLLFPCLITTWLITSLTVTVASPGSSQEQMCAQAQQVAVQVVRPAQGHTCPQQAGDPSQGGMVDPGRHKVALVGGEVEEGGTGCLPHLLTLFSRLHAYKPCSALLSALAVWLRMNPIVNRVDNTKNCHRFSAADAGSGT